MRLALSAPKPVKGRALLDMIAASDLARDLVHSYVCAAVRKERWAVLAPILSPFTTMYSLRLFNEIFELQLGKSGRVTRYGWRYAKWHGRIWLSGQAAPRTSTQKWRLKGAGELGTLPHAKIVAAVEFLTSSDHLQHVPERSGWKSCALSLRLSVFVTPSYSFSGVMMSCRAAATRRRS